MASSDEDEDIRRAIALSLEQNEPVHPSSSTESEADEDDDIKKAMALSLQQDETEPASVNPTDSAVTDSSSDGERPTTTTSSHTDPSAQNASTLTNKTDAPRHGLSGGLAGLDRKEMERQRLARVTASQQLSKKRTKSPSPAPSHRESSPVKKLKTDHGTPSSNIASQSAVPFPRGVIKRTWALGHKRNNDIKLEEILQRNQLKLGLFSSFIWDGEWLFSKLDTQKTNIMMAMQAKDEQTKKEQEEFASEIPNVKFFFPPMNGPGGMGSMHSKLMILGFSNYLRIVIPTGNLHEEDWGEKGTNENSVFLIDLPRLPDGSTQTLEQLAPFGSQLFEFLKAANMGTVSSQLLKFDFSGTKHLAFVHSIAGAHFSPTLERTGLPLLAQSIKDLELDSSQDLELDIITASLGSLNFGYLSEIYAAARGQRDGRLQGKPATSDFFKKKDATKKQQDSTQPASQAHLESHTRIYFPTAETVRNSKGKESFAQTVAFQSKYYNATTFPRTVLRDHESTRNGLLSHNKMILGRGLRKTTDGYSRPVAWVYTGSANLSESAWGKVVMDRARKEPKLNCRNWECGVLMRVSIPEEAATNGKATEMEPRIPDYDVFDGSVDIPCKVPGKEYGTRKPWFFMG